jgi:Bifunctional DNA primase/polymerase, N-terminal/Protein of unknown function (DUF3987)
MNRPMTHTEATELALKLAARWPAFPIAIKWDEAKNGTAKRPLTRNGHHDATTDPDRLRRMFNAVTLRPGEEIGVGIHPGGSGRFVIDVDIRPDVDGHDTLAALESEHGKLPDHPIVLTPSGGCHHYLARPDDKHVGNSHGLGDGIDLRGDDGWVVAPGTCTTWGGWELDEATAVPIPLTPPWLLERVTSVNGSSNGGGRWQLLDRAALQPADRAALEALEALGGHDPYVGGDGSVCITRPGKTAGSSATIGHIGPGIAKVFTPNWSPLEENGVYDADEIVALASGRGAKKAKKAKEGSGEGGRGGLISHNSLFSHHAERPVLMDAAYYGTIGKAVRLLEPHTEADPAALLASMLVGVGTIVGRTPHVIAGHVRHHANLFVNLVGETSKARKGTSWAAVRPFLSEVDADFMGSRVLGGFGSGEAFVDEVRDPRHGKSDDDPGDPGATDKRLLVYESEFSKVLTVCGKDNSTLSPNLRQAWDGTRIENRTRGRKVVTATGHCISVLGHITAEELRRALTTTDAMNGFGNRVLWVSTRRAQLLPFDGAPDPDAVQAIAREIREAVENARNVQRVQFTAAGRKAWEELYRRMNDDDPGGMLGALVARAEPQVLRVALVYALLDRRDLIDDVHLVAAYAFWLYCRASAEWVWGDAIGDEIADTLLRALRRAEPDGLDFSAQSALFGRHVTATRLAHSRRGLEERGLIETNSEETEGRSRNVSRLAKEAKQAKEGET